jgi:lysine 2,3-aminomutase
MPSMIRTAPALADAGLIPRDAIPAVTAVEARYAVGITPAILALIRSVQDPVARQFVPHVDELTTLPHEHPDPIGDDALSPVPGIVHRYPDRVLLKPLLLCPVYCRFCFRREHVGPGGGVLSEADTEAALDYIRGRPEIREVILTGGDPLMLSPRRLAALLHALAAIPHVELLRIHTRVPTTDPSRLTPALAASMVVDTPLWLVVHANHASEFTPDARAALRRAGQNGIPLLGQSVLLRAVNDTPQALEELFRAMLRARVKPYYLHQLDPAPGTARFHVPIAEGQAILAQLRGRITGLAWPTYVLDIPGGHGKVPIGPTYLQPGGVRDPWGHPHMLAGPPTTE